MKLVLLYDLLFSKTSSFLNRTKITSVKSKYTVCQPIQPDLRSLSTKFSFDVSTLIHSKVSLIYLILRSYRFYTESFVRKYVTLLLYRFCTLSFLLLSFYTSDVIFAVSSSVKVLSSILDVQVYSLVCPSSFSS